MELHRIFSLTNNADDTLTLQDARELVGLLLTMTRKTKQKVNLLNSQISSYKGQVEKTQVFQTEVNTELEKWSDNMRRLGVTPLSLWKVRIETEEGLCHWEFPQDDIMFEQ